MTSALDDYPYGSKALYERSMYDHEARFPWLVFMEVGVLGRHRALLLRRTFVEVHS